MRRKTLYLSAALSAFLLLMGVSVSAETETKKYSTATNLGLYGSYTWDVAIDPTDNNQVYLSTYYSPNGFFHSSDGGATWSGLPINSDHGSGRQVEVNPTSGKVYALLNDLLASDDNFATYEIIYEFENSAWDLLYAQSALFVAANDKIYKTSDDGQAFSETTVCEGKTIWSLASSNQSLYALCYDYSDETSTLYQSLNAGTSWVDLNIALDGVTGAERVKVNPVNNYVYLIPSSTGGKTYRSNDQGATWTELSGAPLTGNMAFDSTGRIYVGWYYSDDNGDNWTSFGGAGDYNHIIYVDPTNDDILYDTSAPGFWKSTDQGATWTASVENITGVEVTSVSQTENKETVWAATQNGPAKTTNFTDSSPEWSYVEIDNYMSSGYDAVWVKTDDPNTAVYSSSQSLQYTTDGGTTWTNSTVDITLTGAVFQIIKDDQGNLYGAVGPNTSTGSQTGGVVKSTDSGITWTSLSFPDNKAARSLAVTSNGDIYVGAHSSAGGIYKYDGSSWAKLDAPDDEYRTIIIDPEDNNTIYALSSENGFYKSADQGESWQKRNQGLGGTDNYTEFNSLAIQTSTTPNTLYLSGAKSNPNQGVLYKSADGGENWDLYYTGKKGETFKALLFDGLLAGNSRGLFDLKSKPALTLKSDKNKVASGDQVKFTLLLKDKATDKKLTNKKIRLYKKIGAAEKKYWKTVRTNSLGKKIFKLSLKKKTTIYARWNRNSAAQAEYATTGLKSVTIKMK